MNRQRRIYLALLGLAMIALAVDQFWFAEPASGPYEAEAAAVNASSARLIIETDSLSRVDQAIGRVEDAVASLDREPALAQRLQRLDERHPEFAEPADAFALPDHWRESQLPSTAAPQAQPPDEPDPVDRFQSDHRLQAVIQSGGGGGLTIVNDRPVRVGERIGGFTLTRIEGEEAWFHADGLTASLRLEREGAANLDALRHAPAEDHED